MENSILSGRTRTEVIVKTLALHIAVLASAGHLTSLQNQSRKRAKSIIWELCWFIAVPTYPLAALLDRILNCVNLVRRKGRRSISIDYCISAIMGMHVERMLIGENRFDSVPLLQTRLEDVRRVKVERKNWFWIGRLVVLAALMAQSIATLVLSGRRLKASALGEVDIRNAMMALGGVIVHLNSLCILLRTERWEFVPGIDEHRMEIYLAFGEDTTSSLGKTARALITISTMMNSWYFRFHIRDTYSQVVKKGDKQLYTFPRNLRPLNNNGDGGIQVDHDLVNTFPYKNLYPTVVSVLPNLYWLVWLLLLYPPQQANQLLSLLISAFLSLSFVIEELVSDTFSAWKDPLAETLYVF